MNVRDIFQWDVVNWSRALPLWNERGRMSGTALTQGERGGGLTLFAALQGLDVVCTDLREFPEATEALHRRYGVTEHVRYESADITALPYRDDSFDVVMFKSVLGALSERDRQQQAVDEIHRVLKPGGYLLFAENLEASRLHSLFRRRFVRWSSYWRYLEYRNDRALFAAFESEFRTVGFWGAFGRREWQRDLLGYVDRATDRMWPAASRYILIGACRKP